VSRLMAGVCVYSIGELSCCRQVAGKTRRRGTLRLLSYLIPISNIYIYIYIYRILWILDGRSNRKSDGERTCFHTFSIHTYSIHTFSTHTFSIHTFSIHTFSIHTLSILDGGSNRKSDGESDSKRRARVRVMVRLIVNEIEYC